MKIVRKLVLIGAVGGLGAGCSDRTDSSDLPDIMGSWHATAAVVTSVAKPGTFNLTLVH